jgi:hypothetical protein
MFEDNKTNMMAKEEDPAWQQNNMEYDMRTSHFMLAKVRASEAYAQNLYAAMCNRSFQKNEVWTTLKNQTWSCSWRYAGGIVADMCKTGDYIDWYCSGIKGGVSDDDLVKMSAEDQTRHHWMMTNYVSEGMVTDEIREDLFELGWIVLDDDIDIS